MCGCATKCANPNMGMFVLRVITGVIFVYHGVSKFQDLAGTQAWFSSIGLWSWLANLVATVEVVGGAALILGIWTCIFAPILAVVMLVAIFHVKLGSGWSKMELDWLLLASLVAIKSVGAGNWAIRKGCGCFVCKPNNNTCVDCGHGDEGGTCGCGCHNK